ncbi:flagellar biosynthesis protein FliQ [Clostridium formicaceticum]|uniref:Flagellar biosynthetic protein FliQ n=1 Tax=Clostridium formicaceticum TaxID=1497 RepID=A0AAC9RLH7_9CLOT|nr:flagellar biosynthesis protein FliQ [Clostridium formicaceticum]AOY77304.1 EscS/YscS/HrcS family type III secretion system export apparatus protein [Clostridium formicaceticum]ARE87847.1 Flagellar biosynthetic protein FliQ [Clostridium formicaceticum]
MNEAMVVELGQQTMFTILLMSAPMLGIGLIIGLAVSIFQATTQIQEATLAFIPKIIAVLGSVVIFGPWLLSTIINFTVTLYTNMSNFIQ